MSPCPILLNTKLITKTWLLLHEFSFISFQMFLCSLIWVVLCSTTHESQTKFWKEKFSRCLTNPKKTNRTFPSILLQQKQLYWCIEGLHTIQCTRGLHLRSVMHIHNFNSSVFRMRRLLLCRWIPELSFTLTAPLLSNTHSKDVQCIFYKHVFPFFHCCICLPYRSIYRSACSSRNQLPT